MTIHPTPSSARQPFVSVIVPVFNDTAGLTLCLQALVQQTYPCESYEIIVVDNNSDADISAVVQRFKGVSLLHEAQPSSYAARNCGIRAAVGEAIAFTDADCIPQPNWLEQGIQALLSEPKLGLVAGRIEIFHQTPDQPTPIELYDTLHFPLPQQALLEAEQFGATANVFTFKHVLDDVGPFNANLKSGGDTQWGPLVVQGGYGQLYCDTAVVLHPSRHTFAKLRSRALRLIGGRYDRMVDGGASLVEQLRELLHHLTPPLRYFYRICQDERLPSLAQKLEFTGIMLRLRWEQALERLKLQFGGSSYRG